MAGPASRPIDSEFLKIARGHGGLWDDFEFGRPGKYSCYFEDFNQYVAGDWTVTETDSNATQALATSAPCSGGVLLITNTNADDDRVTMQKVGHGFVPVAGKKIYFECKFQASEATQIDLLAGLCITDTTPLDVSEGVFFRKDDGDALLDFATVIGSASSGETGLATFAAATYFTVGFKITGVSQVDYYINDVHQGTINTNLPTAPLRVTFHIQDGDTGAALSALTASIDHFYVAQEK